MDFEPLMRWFFHGGGGGLGWSETLDLKGSKGLRSLNSPLVQSTLLAAQTPFGIPRPGISGLHAIILGRGSTRGVNLGRSSGLGVSEPPGGGGPGGALRARQGAGSLGGAKPDDAVIPREVSWVWLKINPPDRSQSMFPFTRAPF